MPRAAGPPAGRSLSSTGRHSSEIQRGHRQFRVNSASRVHNKKARAVSNRRPLGPFALPSEKGLGENEAKPRCLFLARGRMRAPTISMSRQRSAASSYGAIARERAGPHAQPRTERRRNILERRPAIAASFLDQALHAKPMTARGTSGIQALHSPARQILHRPSSHGQSIGFAEELAAIPRIETFECEKLAEIVRPDVLVCQAESIQLVGVRLRRPLRSPQAAGVGCDSYCEAALVSVKLFNCACKSAIFLCASPISSCLASIWSCSLFKADAPDLSEE